MDKYSTIISKREEINKKKEQLAKEEKETADPTLTDFTLIPEIYQEFCRLQLLNPDHCLSVGDRKLLLFIILRLYSPLSLLEGRRLLYGLRSHLGDALKIAPHSIISNNIKDLNFSYQTFKEFSKKIDELFDAIINYLVDRGMMSV